MTQPSSPQSANLRPNLGRYGSVGIGRQAVPGTAVVPEHFLRYNGGTPLTPTIVRTRDNYANGSLQQMPERTQGRTLQGKNLNFEVEHAGLKLLLELAMAGVFQDGAQAGDPKVLHLSELNWAENTPLRPCTIEANVPGAPTRITDAQMHNIQLTMNARANWTGQVGFMAVDGEDMTDAAPAATPLDVYQFRDHFLEWGDAPVNPEASSLTLDVGIAAIDAARGNQGTAANHVLGFERNGPIVLSGQFSLPGVPAVFKNAHRNGMTAKFEWVLRKYAADLVTVTKEIRFVVPNAEINTFEPPLGMERTVTPISWTAVSLGGEPAFEVEAIG